jgi:hypothetical protein
VTAAAASVASQSAMQLTAAADVAGLTKLAIAGCHSLVFVP